MEAEMLLKAIVFLRVTLELLRGAHPSIYAGKVLLLTPRMEYLIKQLSLVLRLVVF
jgi:hypothetical protein